MNTESGNHFASTIAIIGGGIGGCITALKLAEQGMKVIVIERCKEILSATSDRTPGRMGLGFHYLNHVETAAKYLQATIGFIKKYPGFIIGGTDQSREYLRQGRYFITQDSLITSMTAVKVASKLQKLYRKLVTEDPSNLVFGNPDKFFRIMNLSEYSEYVDLSRVAIGIETQESMLDWPSFKAFLVNKLQNNNNITLLLNSQMVKSDYNKMDKSYLLTAYQAEGNISHRIKTNYVVNASWENIEKVNSIAGINSSNETHSNRLKLLAEVELPDELQKTNSMFFCSGPHCMFSNMGNGLGRVTYAPITNQYVCHGLELPKKYRRWLQEGLNAEEESKIGAAIIEGLARYIPLMKKARLKKIFAGIVKSKGPVDIYDQSSPFHKRNYSGVVKRREGWIDNACMKLFYCEENAQEVCHIISNG